MISTRKWIKPILMATAMTGCVSIASAQYEKPLYNDALYLGNIYSTSSNPASISFAPLDMYTDINVSYGLTRGDYHDVDRSSKINGLGIEIKGLKKFKRAACFGSITYNNDTEYERCWNSSLFPSFDNPYILGDSIISDFRSEIFTLQGIASYHPAEDWTLGVDLNYKVGSSSDQTDPRSESTGMRFNATPGVTWHCADRWRVGLSANIGFYKEKTTHTVINTQRTYSIFVFSGLGFHDGITTNSTLGSGYKRDYSGMNYGGAIQLAYEGDRISNFLEIGADIRYEDARDGGKTIEYKGGDYDRTSFGLKERFSIAGDRLMHNITLAASMRKVEGMSYTQELRNNPNKNNEKYYVVLDSAVTYTEDAFEASIEYRMNVMRNETPWLTWYVSADMRQSKANRYFYADYEQNYTRLTAKAGVNKNFFIKESLLSLAVDGEYALPLSNDDYTIYDRSTVKTDNATGFIVFNKKDVMPERYIYPRYEYRSSAYAAVGVKLSTDIPISTRNSRVWLGASAQVRAAFYLGDAEYYNLLHEEIPNLLDDTKRINARFGIHLKF